MSNFSIDREMLESYSTSEIKRILREDYDDYTSEAIEIFKDILESRGEEGPSNFMAVPRNTDMNQAPQDHFKEGLFIRNPSDVINFLNDLLSGVMNGTVKPSKAGVSVEIVMAILKAQEAAFLTEGEEE